MDWNIIGKLIVEYGIFGGLFVGLLLYVLKENKVRETALTKVLNTVADCYKTLSVDSNKVAHAVHDNILELSKDVDTLHGKVVVVEDKVDNLDKKVEKIGDRLDTINSRI